MKMAFYRALKILHPRKHMLHRDDQYLEARFSCTAQVMRNNQNILNE